MPRKTKSLAEQIREAKLKVIEVGDAYRTQLYLETMPEYDPLYKYCYGTSSMAIRYEDQCPVAWIRAVIKHMSARRPGHGGSDIPAVVIQTMPRRRNKPNKLWLDYSIKKLKKLA